MNCENILSNLPAAECDINMPGVQRLMFIPRQDVEAINALTAVTPTAYEDAVIIGNDQMQVQAVTVNAGKYFGEIYCADEMGSLEYEPQGQLGSRSLKATLEVFHPGLKARLLGYMSIALNVEFVLLVGLSNGDWHLLGDLRRGARLDEGSNATSGKAATDANGGTLRFIYNCQAPRVFFPGWDPDNPTYGVERYRVAFLIGIGENKVLGTHSGKAIGVTTYQPQYRNI